MIRDFLLFFRHFREAVHPVRGILLALLLLLSVCALVIMFAEDISLGDSVYLTLITALTVGYGDIVPETAIGRAGGVAAALIGVVFIGLTVAIATRALNQFAEEKKRC